LKAKLAQIADIKTGIFAKPESDGEVVYLQAKHFNEFGKLSSIPHADLKTDNLTNKHLLKHDDIVFAAKGSKNFAAVYQSDFRAVASTTFFVIKIRVSHVLPEYLAWILNNSEMQSILKRHAIGSSMVSISKAVLEELEISVPTIEKQKQIVEISRLSKTEHELRLKIAELRQRQIQQQITHVIKE
jgi:restriction endonuclease S subunit